MAKGQELFHCFVYLWKIQRAQKKIVTLVLDILLEFWTSIPILPKCTVLIQDKKCITVSNVFKVEAKNDLLKTMKRPVLQKSGKLK